MHLILLCIYSICLELGHARCYTDIRGREMKRLVLIIIVILSVSAVAFASEGEQDRQTRKFQLQNTFIGTYNAEWFTPFWSGVFNIKNGDISVQDYLNQVEPEMQELLDEAIELQNSATK